MSCARLPTWAVQETPANDGEVMKQYVRIVLDRVVPRDIRLFCTTFVYLLNISIAVRVVFVFKFRLFLQYRRF